MPMAFKKRNSRTKFNYSVRVVLTYEKLPLCCCPQLLNSTEIY